jgi:hypothetical protein
MRSVLIGHRAGPEPDAGGELKLPRQRFDRQQGSGLIVMG